MQDGAHLQAQQAQVELGEGAAVAPLGQAGAQEGVHVPVKGDAMLLLRLCQAPQELCASTRGPSATSSPQTLVQCRASCAPPVPPPVPSPV